MSTRSGKRIHNSIHENIQQSDIEEDVRNERKTRSKRLKENIAEISIAIKTKKRKKYVSCPTEEEESVEDTGAKRSIGVKKTKKRKNYVSYPTEDESDKESLSNISIGTKKRKNVSDATEVEESAKDIKPKINISVEKSKKRKNRVSDPTEDVSVKDSITNISIKTKNRKNYVSYSTREEKSDIVDGQEVKNTCSLLINALKERNIPTESNIFENLTKIKKHSKKKRRKCKLAEDHVLEDHKYVEPNSSWLLEKKQKKIKEKIGIENQADDIEIKKKSKKEKDCSWSIVVEDILTDNKTNLNCSNASTNSFHSAAGSPLIKNSSVTLKETETINSISEKNSQNKADSKENGSNVTKAELRKTRSRARVTINSVVPVTTNQKVKESQKRKSCLASSDVQTFNSNMDNDSAIHDNLLTKLSKKRKSSIKQNVHCDDEFDNPLDPTKNMTVDLDDNNKNNGTELNDCTVTKSKTNMGVSDDNSEKKPESFQPLFNVNNTCKDKKMESEINTTYEKSEISQLDCEEVKTKCKSVIVNTTIELDPKQNTTIKDATFDKDTGNESFPNNLNNTNTSLTPQKISVEMNSTFDKPNKDTTFDKDKKLDTTFDVNSKSSLISSDNSTINLDKSTHIIITSDESKESLDNIANMTPVLIESSLERSQINNLSPILQTPLKREGTFTKDESEVTDLLKLRGLYSPTKRASLPSPGCTPFLVNRNSVKEKMINVTRSIEKSRRSSVTEPLPRTTKVMFCSPVNNPAAVMQQKKKVIKSSLKGSNKSFVFEDTVAGKARGTTAGRKRSYTCEPEGALAKRTRLTEGQQHSVDRLSRPRTCSAAAKLSEPSTPSKKAPTPSKSKEALVSRTKLPNFAALHQKQFDKMESLGECQQRKAKRAKQLLTPNGALEMLDRISPKDKATEPQEKIPPKKPETPIKSLPTLKSLNPGYTRFGFKLNMDVNPFSITSKNDVFNFTSKKESVNKKTPKSKELFKFSSKKFQPKTVKPNEGTSAEHAMQPSLSGATSRKEVAKQSVMREKSFSDKRIDKRNENRTVIKGVRTNRRFELQMKMRNINS